MQVETATMIMDHDVSSEGAPFNRVTNLTLNLARTTPAHVHRPTRELTAEIHFFSRKI
jgi:hypothetical protein